MDDFDLKCLPTNFVGTSRPSKVIEALNAKRENAEKKALQDMRADNQEICDKYEKIIEEQSEELKRQLHDLRGLIKDVLYDIKEKTNRDNANSFENIQFQHVCKRIQEYTRQQHDLVEVFYFNLLKVEKDKSKELTEVLKRTYEDIKRISFKLPNEYDELIELQMENTNQTILCNSRNFLELKTQLQVELQQYTRGVIYELQKVKENWVKFVRTQTEKDIGSLKNQYAPDLTKTVDELSENVRQISQDLHRMDTVTNIQNPEVWLGNVRQTLAILDQKAQKILMNYKQAAILIYNRFFQELKVIEEALAELEDMEPVAPTQAATYTPELQEIPKLYGVELEKIQTVWNDLVDQLTKTVDNTYRFLVAATILWQKHFRRTEVLQVLILKDIENTIKTNNTLSEPYETKLNVLIDTLRQEPTKERLKKGLEDIQKLLLTVEGLYKSQHQAELAVMKKYKSTHELKMDVLIAEVKRFLTLYPPDQEKDPKIQRKRASQTSEITDPNEGLIPVQMIYCKFQIDAVSNWQLGLWECITNYTAVARTEIAAQTDKWSQVHLEYLEKRLSLRLAIHALRMEKIQAYIYEERLEELCVHQSRLDEHKGAVEKRLVTLKEEYKFYQDLYDTILKDYKNEMYKIESVSIESENSFEVASLKPVLEDKTAKCLEEINGLTEEYLGKCQAFSDGVRASHIVLVERMRLFSEEGNFSIQETKDVVKNIEKIEAQVAKTIEDIRKKVEADVATIVEPINARDAEIHYEIKAIKEEHQFNESLNKNRANLQKDLIKEVCALQCKFKTLTDDFEQAKPEILENCGSYEYFLTFSEKMKDMAQKLKEMAEYLDEAVPVRFYSDKSASELAPPSHHKTQDSRIHEITERLFNFEILQDQNTLFINLNKILRQYWDDIIVYSKQFYISKRRCFFLGDDKICYNLLKLMKEMYKKFFHIQNQCETRSMQDTKEYLYFATNCLIFLEEYLENYVDEYSRKTLKNFDHFYETEIKHFFADTKTSIKEQYNKLNQKLRPSYGHPKNRKILENLQIEAEIIYSKTAEMLLDIRMPYLDKLEDEYNRTVSEYYDLKALLPEILQITQSLKTVVDDLTVKLNEKVKLLRMVVDYCPLEDKDQAKQVILSHCKSFLTLYDSKSLPQLSGSLYFNGQKTAETSILSMDASEITGPGYSFASKSSNSRTLASTATTLGTLEIDVFLGTLKENYDNFGKEINSEHLEKTLVVLRNEWNSAVRRVMDLYSVKYDY